MINASIKVKWNNNLEQQIKGVATANMLDRARRSIRSVTCPVHGSTHSVKWIETRDGIGANIDDPCCDELKAVVKSKMAGALR